MNKFIVLLFTVISLNAYSFASDATDISNSGMSFIENKGQITDQYNNPRKNIDFKLGTGAGLNVFIGSGHIHYQFNTSLAKTFYGAKEHFKEPEVTKYAMYRMDVQLLGADSNAEVITEQKQIYREQYYTAGLGEHGATVSSFTQVTYKNIYPDIDWVLKVSNNRLKHEFMVRKGGDVNDIRLKYAGATGLVLNENGSITATTLQGNITEDNPVIFTQDGMLVDGHYELNGDIVSYGISPYKGILTIDPEIEWSTYYGGTGSDDGTDLATDSDGNIYMTGYTSSISDIATSGVFQDTINGQDDAYFVKFNTWGVRQWATYFGGSRGEEGESIDIDKNGFIYIAGNTQSKTDIATTGAHQQTHGGGTYYDSYLAKFDSAGKRIWSTYYGGNLGEYTGKVKTDKYGYVYLAGTTNSHVNISTPGSDQPNKNGVPFEAFLVKFDSSGKRIWGTYYGDVNADHFFNLAIDSIYLYAAGAKFSDAVFVKYDSSGKKIREVVIPGASTGSEEIDDIDVDTSGNIYVCGVIRSNTTLATPGAHQTVYGGGNADGFLAKYDSSGNKIWSTFYGGSELDFSFGVAVSPKGHIILTGITHSGNGIATGGALNPSLIGDGDAYLAVFNSSGNRIYGTYLGTQLDDVGSDIISDKYNYAYICGYTKGNGLASNNGHQTTNNGGFYDGFLTKICLDIPALDLTDGIKRACIGDTVHFSTVFPGSTWTAKTGSVTILKEGVYYATSYGMDTITYTQTDSCGTETRLFAILIDSMPVITHPSSLSVLEGSNAVFSVTASGSNIIYQWQEDKGSGFQDVVNGGQYSGANTANLTVSMVAILNDKYKFRCIVRSNTCTEISNVAALTVLGINGPLQEKPAVYPNPVKNRMQISGAIGASYKIADMSGRVLKSGNIGDSAATINVANLATGVYVFHVIYQDHVENLKFIKQ